MKPFDAAYGNSPLTVYLYFCAASVKKAYSVGNLGLTGGVKYIGYTVGNSRRNDNILCRPDARKSKSNVTALEFPVNGA